MLNPTLKLEGFQIEIDGDRFVLSDEKGGTHILSPSASRLLRAFAGAATLPETGLVNR